MIKSAEVLAEAMQDEWDEYVGDSGCIPPCFCIHSSPTTTVSARFKDSDFVFYVIEGLQKLGYEIKPINN